MASYSLLTLNIQQDNHYEKIIPFLEQENFDIVCLQEVFFEDLKTFTDLGYEYSAFAFVTRNKSTDGTEKQRGIATLAKYPFTSETIYYYRAPRHGELEGEKFLEKHETISRPLLLTHFTDVTGQTFCLGNTHFTWTPDGFFDTYQENDLHSLLSQIKKNDSMIQVGDFNIPRKYNDGYELLCSVFEDAIPEEITCSLDKDLHRAFKIDSQKEKVARFMVDYIFTKGLARAENIKIHTGISDHCGLSSQIFPYSE